MHADLNKKACMFFTKYTLILECKYSIALRDDYY